MTQTCRPAKCIEAIRVTLLDQCTLLPVCGPLNGYAMGCIIDPNFTPEIEEGEESIVKDNCGEICLRDDRCDLTKRWNLEFKIKEPDPEFLALIEGNPLIVSGGVSIGVRQLAYGACSPYVFLELFERTDDCQTDGDPVYLRHIFPATRLKWTGNEREGVFRILDIEGKTAPVLTDNIGTGPYGDIPAGTFVGATPTENIDYAWFEDDFVPAIQCGAIDVPCPGPTFTSLTSPAPCTLRLDGSFVDVDSVSFVFSSYGLVYFYAPTSPNVGANPPGTVINEWSATGIEISLPEICDDCIESVQFWYYTDAEHEFGPTEVVDPCVPVDGASAPTVTLAESEGCDQFTLHGTNFDVVNHIFINGTFTQAYYDPAGPDAGSNPATATIIAWTPTLIQVFDTQYNPYGSITVTSVHMWGVGDAPDYGTIEFPDFQVQSCINPNDIAVASDAPCEFHITGFNTADIDAVAVNFNGPTTNYYDPLGPNAGLNPGSATIIQWENNIIQISDSAHCDGCISSVIFFANVPPYEPQMGTATFDPCVDIEGGNDPIIYVTTDTALACDGQRLVVLVNSAAAPVLLTLPPTAENGCRFDVKDYGSDGTGFSTTNGITLDPSANNIDGVPGLHLIGSNGDSLRLIGNGTDWVLDV